MLVKLFVLGRPGSGKSTAIRHIAELAGRRNYSTHYIKDYDILLEMYKQDVRQEQFLPADWDGFDVTDFSVLDTALEYLEAKVRSLEVSLLFSERKEIVMLEFARNDYVRALNNFSPDFLKEAYFLFIDANLEICIKRIRSRRTNTDSNSDHHSVSETIMNSYYHTDNWSHVAQMSSEKSYILKNNEKSPDTFKREVGDLILPIFDKQLYLPNTPSLEIALPDAPSLGESSIIEVSDENLVPAL